MATAVAVAARCLRMLRDKRFGRVTNPVNGSPRHQLPLRGVPAATYGVVVSRAAYRAGPRSARVAGGAAIGGDLVFRGGQGQGEFADLAADGIAMFEQYIAGVDETMDDLDDIGPSISPSAASARLIRSSVDIPDPRSGAARRRRRRSRRYGPAQPTAPLRPARVGRRR
jgi:hypothetical protein